jgi:tetratricopeptide (TPR) repeat protein
MENNTINLEQLLELENYTDLLAETRSINQTSPTPKTLFYQAIAYYKLDDHDHAETLLEEIYTQDPNNEITTYLIITKLKLSKPDEANTLFKQLCKTEIPNILLDIQQNNQDMALNRCLFLQSIPIPIQPLSKLDPNATTESLVKDLHITDAIKQLKAEKNT